VNPIPSIVTYLRKCYLNDNIHVEVENLFSKKHSDRFQILGRNELLNANSEFLPLPIDAGLDLLEKVLKHNFERELVYVPFFISGNDFGIQKKICSPLVLYPCKIEKVGGAPFVRLNLKEFRLNYALLRNYIEDSNLFLNCVDDLNDFFHSFPIKNHHLVNLIQILESSIPSIKVASLLNFPSSSSEVELQAKSNEKSFSLLHCQYLLHLKKSVEKRGVLNELDILSKAKKWSRSLEQIFNANEMEAASKLCKKKVFLPVDLSSSQNKALLNALEDPVSIIVGPPGTGKSFTIASIALDHLMRGKSVLVCSQKNHAVDVVGNLLDEITTDKTFSFIRAGRKNYMKQLKIYLENVLNGIQRIDFVEKKDLKKLEKKLSCLEQSFNRLQSLILKRFQTEEALIESKGEWFSSLSVFWNEFRLHRSQDLFSAVEKLKILSDEKNRSILSLLDLKRTGRIHNSLKTSRGELSQYLRSLRSRVGTKRIEIQNKLDMKKVLEVFPIWLVNMSDLSEVLPLQTEMFDLVIVDEASQVNMSMALPALQRAKNAVIVGDPKQLRHISFLSMKQQSNFISEISCENTLNYREDSILDCVSSRILNQKSVSFLNEHFRSYKKIIDFSNRKFYRSSLRIMRDCPYSRGIKALVPVDCKGFQDSMGVNKKEGKSILKSIQIFMDQEKDLSDEICSSIGIVSPFRKQVDALSELFAVHLDPEMLRRHRILIGTPHFFQGEERDVMHVSMTVGKNSHPISYRYLNDENVFNVMITRARHLQYVYTSVDSCDLDRGSLFFDYKAYLELEDHRPKTKPINLSTEAKILRDQLINRGYSVYENHPMAGIHVDLIIEKNHQFLGLDLIGFPDETYKAFSLENYRIFSRTNTLVIPISYYIWSNNRSQIFDRIEMEF